MSELLLTQQQKEILTGFMLGDGSLSLFKNSKNALLEISRSIIDQETIFYHSEIFKDFMTDNGIKTRSIFDSRTNKTYPHIKMRTRALPCFTEFHKIWYSKKKVIPNNLQLTPLTIATWFADDGSVYFHFKNNKLYNNELRIQIATNGFSKEEVYFLAKLLAERYNFRIPVYKAWNKDPLKNQYYIMIVKKSDVKTFLMDIDPYFPLMSRKSDKWRQLYKE